MKEQDAAHSFTEWTYEKDIHGTAYAFYRCNDFEFKAAITNPESLADQLNELSSLRSELQQERELRKELIQGLHQINNLTIINSITVGSAVGAKIKEISESLIKKAKLNN